MNKELTAEQKAAALEKLKKYGSKNILMCWIAAFLCLISALIIVFTCKVITINYPMMGEKVVVRYLDFNALKEEEIGFIGVLLPCICIALVALIALVVWYYKFPNKWKGEYWYIVVGVLAFSLLIMLIVFLMILILCVGCNDPEYTHIYNSSQWNPYVWLIPIGFGVYAGGTAAAFPIYHKGVRKMEK